MYKPWSYVAIDPGNTSGWATFDDKGEIIDYGQFTLKEHLPSLKKLLHENVKTVVVEDYKNYAFKQQKKWSRNETSKLIGAIETVAAYNSVPVVLQMANIKPIGYKWAGLDKAPSNHAISHQYDAIAHGVYWLQQQGIRPVGLAMRKQQKEKDND